MTLIDVIISAVQFILRLILGIMLPTWLLSMWMSNTATTAMMMPIVTAILLQIKECQLHGQCVELLYCSLINPNSFIRILTLFVKQMWEM